mmetsp:Transcript_76944/g.249272  ORF Transcript_76944/g.249272 Transcript_76944/m.249272 type:complete len:108 (-) Transcript_76944:613-936(-)
MQFILCIFSEIPVFNSEDGRAYLNGGTQPSKPNSSRSVGLYARIKPSEAASKRAAVYRPPAPPPVGDGRRRRMAAATATARPAQAVSARLGARCLLPPQPHTEALKA